ncbi:hypothetical protein U27_06354 [Candidatus Vecturithrix granuli]|uniref:Uncharacterized protein n=1 Tax=Vecturithrix granuli TaxID=1499967 RepID=A0A081C465_VECG1|nr:hypothetical protein U27_06354 [Candidatus Vecturithrix granuli]
MNQVDEESSGFLEIFFSMKRTAGLSKRTFRFYKGATLLFQNLMEIPRHWVGG